MEGWWARKLIFIRFVSSILSPPLFLCPTMSNSMSKTNVSIRWKVLKVLDIEPPINENNHVFNILPNPGLFSQFGIPNSFAIVPYIFSPTITYHQVIKKNLEKRLNITIEEKNSHIQFLFRN
jgi:hypothetical protein